MRHLHSHESSIQLTSPVHRVCESTSLFPSPVLLISEFHALFSSFCCDAAYEHLCLRLLLSNHTVTMDYFAKRGWKDVLDRFLWKGKFLYSSQSCMHCSGCSLALNCTICVCCSKSLCKIMVIGIPAYHKCASIARSPQGLFMASHLYRWYFQG